MVLDAHFSVDSGHPVNSLHFEDFTCPRRRDSGRSLTNRILRFVRSLTGWDLFPSTGLDLTEVHVRFRSQVIQQRVRYQWRQTFCGFYMSLETRYLCLRSSDFLWMIRDQMPEAHWTLR